MNLGLGVNAQRRGRSLESLNAGQGERRVPKILGHCVGKFEWSFLQQYYSIFATVRANITISTYTDRITLLGGSI